MMYRDEAEYLREWIEFHLLAGFDRFFLYDNRSRDHHLDVLAPYLEEGTVVLHEWDLPFNQALAHEHCVQHHAADSRWIAFIDVDEFLFSPTLRPLPELLVEYERFPGVAVSWAMFGTSGHRTKPAGLVIENYVRRQRENKHVKTIADPTRISHAPVVPHFFHYKDGERAVNEQWQPVVGAFAKTASFERLRINHYWSKSEEECRRKFAIRAEGGRPRKWEKFEEREEPFNEVPDETITAYVPALRAAISAREERGRATTARR
jgi:hypothetical protein